MVGAPETVRRGIAAFDELIQGIRDIEFLADPTAGELRIGCTEGTPAILAPALERDPQLLDSTIGRLISEQGWCTDVRVHGVFSRWDSIVGREVAQHATPESFGDGKLVVRTDSTAWATQMKLLAPTVVRRLNEELGDGTVTVIDVLGPHGPSWKRGPRSVRDGRGPRDTYG